ncbi:MAG: response regulator transcription factor [Anaerolineae bacterium]|nr:response regulator transcription factor [Anaerolineae bacterium]
MEMGRVLFIGRTQSTRPAIISALEKRFEVVLVTSGKSGIEAASAKPFHIIVLDAASMRTPGDRVCRELRSALPHMPLVHIHPGPKETAQSAADTLLFMPVTPRKLVNSVERLLQVQSDDFINCGPFSINLARRVLTVHGQETQLTPKQALLVEVFLRNPGATLDRRTLMEKVWQTDYLGDTRTLDVHIRWIRELIESDPSNPRYLRTVRGIGYRLDVPDEILTPEIEMAL